MSKDVNQLTRESITSRLSNSLSSLERKHKRFMNAALEEAGVRGIPYRFFLVLMKYPQSSQDFLAEYLGVDKSHIARKIREMELSGYVERELDPENRRQYKLRLTDKGKEIHSVVCEKSEEWAVLMTKEIDEADLTTTFATIHKIIENLDALNK